MRKADIRLPDAEWDGHLLLLHGSEPERLSSLAAWIRRGLNRGDKVIYAEAPRAVGESVLDIPDGQGVELAAAMADGRLTALPLERFYPQGDQEAVVDQALADGFTSVRLAAEAGAALGTGSLPDHLTIERTIDVLCRTRPVSALCQYSHSATETSVLRELVATHRYHLRKSALTLVADSDVLVLRGEIDRGNADILATAVNIQSARADGVVRLDLAAVEFMDVAACRQLLDSSRSFRHVGGHLILAEPQPSVDGMLRILGVDEFIGVQLVGSCHG